MILAKLQFLINLEYALTAQTQPWHDGEYKPFNFRAEPTAAETLKIGRVNFASVGNNDICDFGADGLLDRLISPQEAWIDRFET